MTPQIGGITSSQQESVITPVATVGDNTSAVLLQAVKLTSNAEASRMRVKAKLKDKDERWRRVIKNRKMIKKKSDKRRKKKKSGGTGKGSARRKHKSMKKGDMFTM